MLRSFWFLVPSFWLWAIWTASEILDEPAYLPPDRLGLRVETFEGRLCDIIEVARNIQMTLYLQGGSLSDGQIPNEFDPAVLPKSLSDVRHDRNARPLNLIPEAEIFSERPRARCPIDLNGPCTSALPAFNVFETRDHHNKEGANRADNFSTRNQEQFLNSPTPYESPQPLRVPLRALRSQN